MVPYHERYLGLPTVVGRSKRSIAMVIRDKLWRKLQGWKGMKLSKAAREVLIKAVAQSIPTYAMSVFKIPQDFGDDIRKVVSQFWWGHTQGEKKIHWLAWKKLCRPKTMGGIGFRDYKMFNWALLGKQTWHLCTNTYSLMARVISGKYFHNSSFLEANIGNNPSYTWRGIWEAKWVLNRGIRWRVGDGKSIRVWRDPWIPRTQTRRVLSPCRGHIEEMLVKELLRADGNGWDEVKVRNALLAFEADAVLSIPIIHRHPRDDWCWDLENNGVYSVKSAYRAIFGGNEPENAASSSRGDGWIWSKIWKVPIIPRVKMFFWQLCNIALPTKERLKGRTGIGDGVCPMCAGEEETDIHAMRDCRVARMTWARRKQNLWSSAGPCGGHETKLFLKEKEWTHILCGKRGGTCWRRQ